MGSQSPKYCFRKTWKTGETLGKLVVGDRRQGYELAALETSKKEEIEEDIRGMAPDMNKKELLSKVDLDTVGEGGQTVKRRPA